MNNSCEIRSTNIQQRFNYFQVCKRNDFAIVTFDEDYFTLSVLSGSPPKIIWLRTGNISTKIVHDLLLSKKKLIEAFLEDKEIDTFDCLEIDGRPT